jgi:hypothetical protein
LPASRAAEPPPRPQLHLSHPRGPSRAYPVARSALTDAVRLDPPFSCTPEARPPLTAC